MIFCCNPLAIVSIILSAIASGEFKRGLIDEAAHHARLSKIISAIALALSLLAFVAIAMVPTDEKTETETVPVQVRTEDGRPVDKDLAEAVTVIAEREGERQGNDPQTDVKQPPARNGNPVDEDIKRVFLKRIEERQRQGNGLRIQIRPSSSK